MHLTHSCLMSHRLSNVLTILERLKSHVVRLLESYLASCAGSYEGQAFSLRSFAPLSNERTNPKSCLPIGLDHRHLDRQTASHLHLIFFPQCTLRILSGRAPDGSESFFGHC